MAILFFLSFSPLELAFCIILSIIPWRFTGNFFVNFPLFSGNFFAFSGNFSVTLATVTFKIKSSVWNTGAIEPFTSNSRHIRSTPSPYSLT